MWPWPLIVLSLFAWAQPALAHDTISPRRTAAVAPLEPGRDEKSREYFTDRGVITQDGTRLRFYSDVLKDKVVLISFFFSSCKDACPLINARLATIQALLGERLGTDIVLVSLTVDPERDRPDVLKEYAARFGAHPGWLFLTGDRHDLELIARKLGNTAPDPRGHATTLILGNVSEARWEKMLANAPEEAVVARLLDLAVSATTTPR